MRSDTSRIAIVLLGGLWLLYQPLINCLAQGNIEILEMTLILGALVFLGRASGHVSGLLLGIATMLKALPLGFLIWLAGRRQWRCVLTGGATIVSTAILASFTLGWSNSRSLNRMATDVWHPPVSLHDLSLTSAVMRYAGTVDRSSGTPVLQWASPEDRAAAAMAGFAASLLIALCYGILLFSRRRRAASDHEVGILFVLMFLLLPWNHDYYYLFAIVPFSFLFLEAATRHRTVVLAWTVVGYILISPPVPFSLVDRTSWFQDPFAYTINLLCLPVAGAVLLLLSSTHQMMVGDGRRTAVSEVWWPTPSMRIRTGASSRRRGAPRSD